MTKNTKSLTTLQQMQSLQKLMNLRTTRGNGVVIMKFEDTGIAKKLEDALYWAEIICQENSDYLELRGFNTKVLRDKFQEAKELIR